MTEFRTNDETLGEDCARVVELIMPPREPWEKKRLVLCPCCQSWLTKGSLGPHGCPTCGGCL